MNSLRATYKDRKFHWSSGKWVDSQTYIAAPAAIHSHLTSDAIASLTAGGGKKVWSRERRLQLFALLHDTLGAPLEHLAGAGFFDEVQEQNPEIAIAALYEGVDVSEGLSFHNCERLRDRFFQKVTPSCFGMPVRIVGDGPFTRGDLKTFLSSRGIRILHEQDIARCVVLGRNGWSKAEVDQIVEQSEAAVLRVYSQEMFIAVLAGQPDPFQTFPLSQRLWDLYAFRLGHPGLEYISQGWGGWHYGYRNASGVSHQGRRDITEAVEQSPLAVMGYRVGAKGLGPSERRMVLRRAFVEPLPFVVSESYMEQWGRAETGRRLKRLVTHLTSLIEANKNRPNLDGAMADWSSDLSWLHDELYRGVMKFDWPQL